jgi:hypothetical protein
MNHPILAYITDPTEVQYEGMESRRVLEKYLKHPISTFAYLVGLFQHIGEYGLRAVEQAKFDWALTTMFGFNIPQSHPLLLRRIVVDTNQHWTMLAAKTCGLWSSFARIAECLKPSLERQP